MLKRCHGQLAVRVLPHRDPESGAKYSRQSIATLDEAEVDVNDNCSPGSALFFLVKAIDYTTKLVWNHEINDPLCYDEQEADDDDDLEAAILAWP
jgi:hypothetical protein